MVLCFVFTYSSVGTIRKPTLYVSTVSQF